MPKQDAAVECIQIERSGAESTPERASQHSVRVVFAKNILLYKLGPKNYNLSIIVCRRHQVFRYSRVRSSVENIIRMDGARTAVASCVHNNIGHAPLPTLVDVGDAAAAPDFLFVGLPPMGLTLLVPLLLPPPPLVGLVLPVVACFIPLARNELTSV